MHDGVQCDPIQGQGYEPFIVDDPFKLGNRPFSKAISAIYNGSRQLTTDS